MDDQLDEPCSAAVERERWLIIARRAAARGSRLHLTGFGGDELLYGSLAHLHSLLRTNPRAALRHLRGFAAKYRWPRGRMLRQLSDTSPYGGWPASPTPSPPRRRRCTSRCSTGGSRPGCRPGRRPAAVQARAGPDPRRGARPPSPWPQAAASTGSWRRCGSSPASPASSSRWPARLGVTLAAPYYDDRVVEAGLAVRPGGADHAVAVQAADRRGDARHRPRREPGPPDQGQRLRRRGPGPATAPRRAAGALGGLPAGPARPDRRRRPARAAAPARSRRSCSSAGSTRPWPASSGCGRWSGRPCRAEEGRNDDASSCATVCPPPTPTTASRCWTRTAASTGTSTPPPPWSLRTLLDGAPPAQAVQAADRAVRGGRRHRQPGRRGPGRRAALGRPGARSGRASAMSMPEAVFYQPRSVPLPRRLVARLAVGAARLLATRSPRRIRAVLGWLRRGARRPPSSRPRRPGTPWWR